MGQYSNAVRAGEAGATLREVAADLERRAKAQRSSNPLLAQALYQNARTIRTIREQMLAAANHVAG